jgi:hypothetical protein
LIDPTRPPPGIETEQTPGRESDALPKFSGARIGKKMRVAMLNGVAVRVGDVVDGYEVLAIEATRVKLMRNGSETELQLLPDIKKVEHKGP